MQSFEGRVLVIAGSDSGGGAGIQADIKTISALGGYAATAITALTAQNTLGVQAIHPVSPDFVIAQMRAVLDDIGADCMKTGMLPDAETVRAICDFLDARECGVPLVVDPVMVATSGDALAGGDMVGALRERLLPRATVITPNLAEAEQLTGIEVADTAAMIAAGRRICDLGAQAALITGGHLTGDEISDVLIADGDVHIMTSPRIDTRHTHGTGCTLASAIAAGLAQQMPLIDAVLRAREFVARAIRQAPGLGQGHGPLNHNPN
jgi:hydroxymethylpyrimidine/phosphomethylpyrimidine kinase